MFSRFLKLFVVLLLITSCDNKDPKLSALTVETTNGPVVYMVETASTPDEMVTGLMNRQELNADSGMIFDIDGRAGISMWMKDTYIPLDMIFTDVDGRIIWLHENAEPLSTDLIRPDTQEPIGAVIELNAGEIASKQIKVGDHVSHEILK